MNVQRESRDADIFRRVVDRIKVCIEEATAPAATAAAAASTVAGVAGATGGTAASTRSENSTSLPSAVKPIDSTRGGKKKGKGKGRAGAGGATAATGGWTDGAARCNWTLAHAACRVCRVVGRTFQVAIRCVCVCLCA